MARLPSIDEINTNQRTAFQMGWQAGYKKAMDVAEPSRGIKQLAFAMVFCGGIIVGFVIGWVLG